MPFPQWLARLNRRVTNPVARTLAGSLPPLAIVEHVGRVSGVRYRTPVLAFPTPDGWVIPLPYGSGTDWQRNLEDTDSGTLVSGGEHHPVADPHVIAGDPPPGIPEWTKAMLGAINADEFLVLRSPDDDTPESQEGRERRRNPKGSP